jgi:hypothetical protein
MTSRRLTSAAALLAALAILGPAAPASAATVTAATASAATASAATATAATVTAASAATASAAPASAAASLARATAATPPPAAALGRVYSVEEAGYRASGAGWRFRLARATVTLPSPSLSPYSGGEALSVQLRASDQTVVLGISAVPGSTVWSAAVAVEQKDGQGGCATSGGCFSHLNSNSPAFAAGDSVTFDLYYHRSAGTLYYTASDSTLGQAFVGWFQDGGEQFSSARVGAEFGPDSWTRGTGYHAPARARALAAFTAVRFTSGHGTKGTLGGAPWTTRQILLSSTGTVRGTVIAAPSVPAGTGATSFTVTAAAR